ncbi:MAG: hypothetical protein ACKO7D_04535 [Bacteroidota bacterium]
MGPVEFLASESDSEITNAIAVEIADKEAFERKEVPPMNFFNVSPSQEMPKMKIEFPYKTKQTTWENLFAKCHEYRLQNNIPQNELVILLTDISNEYNWFGSIDSDMKTIFIHTSDWHYYFEGLHERFPIAYEIVSWIFRTIMFDNRLEIKTALHYAPRGCLMDFCEDKKQITFKVRTADFCPDCFKILEKSTLNHRIIHQLIDSLEGIRKNFLSVERSNYLNSPRKIKIKGFTHTILIPDFGNIEIPLNPKQKAIYLFFLKHPDGVRIVDLIDHRKEISIYYHRFSNFGTLQEIERSIDLLLDPMDNNINEVLSKIKSAFVKILGQRLAEHYVIAGNRGEPYKIKLSPELIEFESIN